MANLAALAMLAAGAVAHEAPEPSALGLTPQMWVALSMTVLIVIMLRVKVPGIITGGLDKSIAEIRRQLDEAKALYEWKYGKQLLYTQILKDQVGAQLAGAADMASALERLDGVGEAFFSERFLEPRPLLRALREPGGAVLLIDEIDKSDEAFEAFLLEILSAFQVSIPEIGVIEAITPPIVFLTSNNVRDLGDALKRRCLHLHIPLPERSLEERIVASRVPGIEQTLRSELVGFVQDLRTMDLRKLPSISETVDWARALVLLHAHALDSQLVRDTLNVLLKFEQDITAVEPRIGELLAHAKHA